ncbi:MAG: hypothetical protein E4G96_11165 [Chrysiogenales bacterium]|nr:MAG: hypothetical protein E4G96_11165 [Chrysiogenales bacterium]
MAEVEEKSYTPEELAEIERIVDLVERSGRKMVAVAEPPPRDIDESGEVEPEGMGGHEEYHPAPEACDGEPEDVALPAVDLDELTWEEAQTACLIHT